MKNSKFNFQNICLGLIFMTFGIATLFISFSDFYLKFLTPSSFKYLIFMGVILIIYAIIELTQAKKKGTTVNLLSSIVIIIPLAMIFIPNLELDVSHLTTGYAGNMGITSGSSKVIQGENMTFIVEDPKEPTLQEVNSSNSFLTPIKLEGLNEKLKTINISDEQFYDWITEIFKNTDKYIGYTVTVNGMVFIDKEFMGENQFVPSRLLMSCCAADALPSGLIANYKEVSKLKEGEYLRVSGKLIMGEYNSQKGPVIDVNKIEPGEKPKNLYVYPK